MSFWNNKMENPAFEPLPPASQPQAAAIPPPAAREPEPSVPPRSTEAVRAGDERAAPPAAATSATAVPARKDDLRLGRGVRLEGKLMFSGTVRVDATFQGSIVTDGILVVGEDAKVDAEITCGTVIVDGEVNGNVKAKEAVELHATATLRGEVETPSLTVDRGAILEGASRRPAGAASARAGKAAAAPEPSAS
jgi:cytoskeletal protein CcmA (bactofilin family)